MPYQAVWAANSYIYAVTRVYARDMPLSSVHDGPRSGEEANQTQYEKSPAQAELSVVAPSGIDPLT